MNKKLAKEPVRLREKALTNGNKSLYLDIYRDGKRKYEFLKLYIVPEKKQEEKNQNLETLKTAQRIRAKRQIELQNDEYGFPNKSKIKTPFLYYFRTMCEASKKKDSAGSLGNWYSCLKHLERYCTEETTFERHYN
jgi:hypothetical protein